MKSGMLVIGLAVVALAVIVFFFLDPNGLTITRMMGGGTTAADTTGPPPPEHPTVAPKPAPKPKAAVKPAPVEKAAVVEAAPAVPPEPAVAAAPVTPAPPPVPELPYPAFDELRVGSDSDTLAQFHRPSLHTSSTIRGQLLETYVYWPEKAVRETWVVLKDGRIQAKYVVAHNP